MLASAELRADRVIVPEAVKTNGLAFKFALAELRASRVILIGAAKQRGPALECASAELRAGRIIELGALNIDALRGGVAPKSSASARAVCIILEAHALAIGA